MTYAVRKGPLKLKQMPVRVCGWWLLSLITGWLLWRSCKALLPWTGGVKADGQAPATTSETIDIIRSRLQLQLLLRCIGPQDTVSRMERCGEGRTSPENSATQIKPHLAQATVRHERKKTGIIGNGMASNTRAIKTKMVSIFATKFVSSLDANTLTCLVQRESQLSEELCS